MFKVTELSASVTLCCCGCCADIHGLTSSSIGVPVTVFGIGALVDATPFGTVPFVVGAGRPVLSACLSHQL